MKKRINKALGFPGLKEKDVENLDLTENATWDDSGSLMTRQSLVGVADLKGIICGVERGGSALQPNSTRALLIAKGTVDADFGIYKGATKKVDLSGANRNWGDMSAHGIGPRIIATVAVLSATGLASGSELYTSMDDGVSWTKQTVYLDGASSVKMYPTAHCLHKNITFYLSGSEAGTTYINRVRWSGYFDPFNMNPNNDGFQAFEDIGDPYEGIMKLVSFKNELFVFKTKSVWVMSGINSEVVAPEYIRCLSKEHGLVGPGAITVTDTHIVFLADHGLVKFDGTNFTPYNEDIWPLIKNNNRQDWYQAKLLWEHDTQRFYFHDGTQPAAAASPLYCLFKGNWSKITIVGANRFLTGLFRMSDSQRNTGTNLLVSGTYMGTTEGAFSFSLASTGTDYFWDTGTNAYLPNLIPVKYNAPWIDYEGNTKRVRSMELGAAIDHQTQTITLKTYFDYKNVAEETKTITAEESKTRGYTVATSQDFGIVWFTALGGHCNAFRFALEWTGYQKIISCKIGYQQGGGI